MTEETLLKILTQNGIGSRRKMADAIKAGRVQVNWETAEGFKQAVDVTKDVIALDGEVVTGAAQRTVHLLMNKPKGVLSTAADDQGRQTVMDILPKKYKNLRLYPAGRLDKDSSGLLLLTNDGELTYCLTHPSFKHKKIYDVYIKGTLAAFEMKKLATGVKLEDGMASVVAIKRLEGKAPYNYSVTLHGGRKRQIRRMLAALGHQVIELKRVRLGNFTLGSLKEGEIKEIEV